MEEFQHFEHKNGSFLLFPWLTKWCLPLKNPQLNQYVFWIRSLFMTPVQTSSNQSRQSNEG